MGVVSTARPEAAVVVDPYSSGRFMLYELKSRGVNIVCVRSTLDCSEYFLKTYDSHKSYFAETLDFDSFASVESLAEAICRLPYRISGVIAGSEPGVDLADRLAEELEMPTANGTELLQARKDKAEMQDRLRHCGVPAAEQFRSSSLSDLTFWASERGQWPVVAKPISSAGSDGVFFCNSEDDLVTAHREIIGKVNPNGVVNDEIALQEFLDGDEYIVDTVSHEGRHLCVALWVYEKRRGLPWNSTAIMSESNRLLDPAGEIQQVLLDYVFRVLDAVGLRFGPCHTEVMLTKRGPILVEVNARMHGLQGPRLIELATGTSKATYAADSLLSGGELFNKLHVPSPGRWLYPVHKQCMQMILISPVEGALENSIKDAIEALRLESVVEVLHVGPNIKQTCDLATSPGQVLMVHESMEQIQADIMQVRELENNGSLYKFKVEK